MSDSIDSMMMHPMAEMDIQSFNNRDFRPAVNMERMKITKGGRPRQVDQYCFRKNAMKNVDPSIKSVQQIYNKEIKSNIIHHMMSLCDDAMNATHLAYMRRSKMNKNRMYKNARLDKVQC